MKVWHDRGLQISVPYTKIAIPMPKLAADISFRNYIVFLKLSYLIEQIVSVASTKTKNIA
jgi:hypothetical protein